ncbi:MAG: alpha-hydroxy-acid oxidizing protein [Saprospiraceae bacterium]|nr:alpha-hydroxy-acid oxidizing protein [Saprospiraceae bacterium]
MDKPFKTAVDLQKLMFLGGLRNDIPKTPLNTEQLRLKAKDRLSPRAFDYLDGGAGMEKTMLSNTSAFGCWQIVPQMLKDVSLRDTSVELFGSKWVSPFFLCPIGVLELAHRQSDLAVARASAVTDTPLMISSQSSTPMEDIAAAMPETPKFFQLYWSKSDDLVASFVSRAESCGCSAIVVTLDTTILGWRLRDLQHAYLPFLYGMGLAQYIADPVFQRLMVAEPPPEAAKSKVNLHLLNSLWQMARRYPGSTWHNFRSRSPLIAIRKFIDIYMNPALQWSDLSKLRAMTNLPVILKGIQHPDDARKAIDYGLDGIVVSNHGGRQIDGAIGSLDALVLVKQAIGNQIPILFDSGVRTGSDAFKAIALGADAVGIGRPYAYGLAVGGTEGVQSVIEYFRAEFELTMALSGCHSIDDNKKVVLKNCR